MCWGGSQALGEFKKVFFQLSIFQLAKGAYKLASNATPK